MPALHLATDQTFGRCADNDNRREPERTRIARRCLLASRTIVACAARTAPTKRESFYAAEHAWAIEHLMHAVMCRDFSGWSAGDEHTSPDRWRLARRMTELRQLPGPTAFEAMLREEFERLWTEIAAPALVDCAA